MRTYLPGLKAVLKKVCKYIANHRDSIVDILGSEHAAKVDAVVTACNILMPVIDDHIPPAV